MSSTAAANAVQTLQTHLVDLLDASLLAKQAHWNVVGPNFRPLHEQLDEIAGSVHEFADETAERIRALGDFPNGQARDIFEAGSSQPWTDGPLVDHDVVAGMADRMSDICRRTQERIQILESEPASQDLLIAHVQELEKQTWMLQAQKSSAPN